MLKIGFTRRGFLRESLRQTGSLLAGSVLIACARQSIHPHFGSPSAPRERVFFVTDPTLTKNGVSSLCILDPEIGTISAISVPLELGHGCFANPKMPDQVFIVEQGGPRACGVNISSREVRTFRSNAEEFDFYGHGLFLPGGDFFVTTEVHRISKEGRIAVRRADTFSVADVIPSFGKLPHDLRLLHGGEVLVTANHGTGAANDVNLESSVCFVDWKSKKLLGQCPIEEPGCFASHLEAVADDEVLVACRRLAEKHDLESERLRRDLNNPAKRTEATRNAWKTVQFRAAPLYWIKNGTLLAEEPAASLSGRMKNSLSLAYAPKASVLGLTHLDADIVSFWDTKTRRLLKILPLSASAPHGLAYLEPQNVFVVGLVKGLAFIDGATLTLKPGLLSAPFGIHLGKTS